MRYNYIITIPAYNDIQEIIKYLAINLLEPKIAQNYYDLFFDSFEKIKNNPMSYPIVDDKMLGFNEVRKFNVKNYLVFYTISQNTKEVIMLRVLHSRKNWKKIMK